MEVRKIGVVGAGTMGNSIAQLAAQIGCDVVMRDIEMRFVEGGMNNIERFLSKSVEKGKMDATEKDAILGRIKGTVKRASKWVAPNLMKTMIRAGKFGRKTGGGWYHY